MKKLVLGVAIVFVGSMVFTSCSSDSTVMSQFSKRKYMKNFKKSKLKQKESINEYKYAEAVAETETKTASFDNIVLEEIVATDNSEMVTFEAVNQVETEKTASTDVTAVSDYSSWNEYNRNADMGEAINYHDYDASRAAAISNVNSADQILIILFDILLPPLGVYLAEGSIGSNFWWCLVLTLLGWIPGIIYALVVTLG